MFLHDPLIKIENVHLRPCRPNGKQTTVSLIKDTFYWPDMERKDICQQIDPYTRLPDPNQCYVIPYEFRHSKTFHDRGIYSLWNHFVETCHRSRCIENELNHY